MRHLYRRRTFGFLGSVGDFVLFIYVTDFVLFFYVTDYLCTLVSNICFVLGLFITGFLCMVDIYFGQ